MTAVDPAHAEFGKYQLLRKLAQGGMAEIFLASQRGIQGFEKQVVLKRVLPDLTQSDEFVQMFLDEARIAARLEHPNIVRIYDLGEVKGQYFIAMEYIAGEDLASVIQQCKRQKQVVPIEFAAEVVLGAAEALHFAHEMEDADGKPMHLVHRDVSPSNIIYTYQGTAKLVDFGIARAESNVSKTDGGQVKGKIQYLSPEQCRTERADARSDIWALGVTLYEVLTCKRLFQRENLLSTMNAIMKGEVAPPHLLRPDLPPELEAIIMKALQREAKDRYQSAGEMAADLTVFLSSREWQRGIKAVDFLAKLFGEERKKAKLRVSKGQRLDEAGYAASVSVPAPAPGARITGEHEAVRPGSAPAHTPGGSEVPPSSSPRPPTSPSQVHARPPSSPSQVTRTPAPPAINPVSVPRRPSYSQLPAVPGVSPPTRPPSSSYPAAPGTPAPTRPSSPRLPQVPQVPAAGSATRPSYPNLGAALGSPAAPARPAAPQVAQYAGTFDPNAPLSGLNGDEQLSPLELNTMAVQARESLFAMPARPAPSEPPPNPFGLAEVPGAPAEQLAPPQPLPPPRPSRDLTLAAAAAAARIQAEAARPLPVALPQRSSRWPFILVAVALLGAAMAAVALSSEVRIALGLDEPPIEAPAPAPTPAPPPKPELQVGGVTFTGLPANAKLTVDGAPVGNPAGENFFSPGPHRLVVEARGFAKYEATLEVAVGKVLAHEVKLVKAKPGSKK